MTFIEKAKALDAEIECPLDRLDAGAASPAPTVMVCKPLVNVCPGQFPHCHAPVAGVDSFAGHLLLLHCGEMLCGTSLFVAVLRWQPKAEIGKLLYIYCDPNYSY